MVHQGPVNKACSGPNSTSCAYTAPQSVRYRCMIHLATHTPANESVGAVGILAQEMYQLGALHTGGWSTPVCGRLDQTIPLSSVSPNGRQLMEGSGAQGEGGVKPAGLWRSARCCGGWSSSSDGGGAAALASSTCRRRHANCTPHCHC